MHPIFIAFISAVIAQTSIDYSGCANQDCTTTTNPNRDCSLYAANLPLTGACQDSASGLSFLAVAGAVANTATVSTFSGAGCGGTALNVNTNLPRS